jgi:hypothetical protein
MERIGELVLEHASPAGRTRPAPLLLVHGMWGGSWYLRNYLYAAALRYLEAAGHAHMLMLEEGWEKPFDEILDWVDRNAGGPAS